MTSGVTIYYLRFRSVRVQSPVEGTRLSGEAAEHVLTFPG